MRYTDLNNAIVREDIDLFITSNQDLHDRLRGKTVLVTGATGLIGSFIVFALISLSKKLSIPFSVIAHGRSLEKLVSVFGEESERPANLVLSAENCGKLSSSCSSINYIFHTACPTASRDFVEKPLEVIDSIYSGTKGIIELAEEKRSESIVYLSSMEVYGQVNKDVPLSEDDLGQLDLTTVRSSYPMAKRLAELLCRSFYEERSVPVKIVRLSMVFGPGVQVEDKRVLNYFVQQVRKGLPITLLTEGKSKASVLYLLDAVNGVYRTLLSGENGQTYNLANPANYLSIKQMAEVASNISGCDLKLSLQNKSKLPYREDSFLNLDVSRVRALGWEPTFDLSKIFHRVLQSQS